MKTSTIQDMAKAIIQLQLQVREIRELLHLTGAPAKRPKKLPEAARRAILSVNAAKGRDALAAKREASGRPTAKPAKKTSKKAPKKSSPGSLTSRPRR